MGTIKKLFVLFGMVLFIAAPIIAVATPTTSFAADPIKIDPKCEKAILGIHPWFRGLSYRDGDNRCVIAGPGQIVNGKTLDLSGFIWRIALNLIEIVLGIMGYIAFFFIIYGGFQFLTGGSNPGQIEKARKTLLNAVIGLVIALSAVALVNLVFGILG